MKIVTSKSIDTVKEELLDSRIRESECKANGMFDEAAREHTYQLGIRKALKMLSIER